MFSYYSRPGKFECIQVLILFLFFSCEDPYAPGAVVNPDELLVVEGFIEINDVSSIKLSHTRKISEGTAERYVNDAIVTIESDNNISYPLSQVSEGMYQSEKLILSPFLKYRIKIFLPTASYVSDFVEAKVAAPIDSIYWQAQADGVQLYLDSQDPTENSKFYRWTFEECWEFRSKFPALYIYDPSYPDFNHVRLRNLPEEAIPNTCFESESSKKIYLGTTASLAEDIIFKFPLHKIALNSNRLQTRYSILVNQYILSKEGFQYWESLKKNADNMGSLFDSQPYQLKGNIHRVDAEENVIGYISAGAKSKKRIFISNQQLPLYKLQTVYDDCLLEYDRMISKIYNNTSIFPLGLYPDPQNPLNSIPAFTTIVCVDCRYHGSAIAPDYW